MYNCIDEIRTTATEERKHLWLLAINVDKTNY